MTIYKNKAIIIGNLGNDPEIKKSEKGNEFATFSVATTEFYKDKENNKATKTEWHNVVVFTSHFVGLIKQFVKKGDSVYIEGSLSTNKWKDQDNKEHVSTQIIVNSYNDDFQFNSKEKGETK